MWEAILGRPTDDLVTLIAVLVAAVLLIGAGGVFLVRYLNLRGHIGKLEFAPASGRREQKVSPHMTCLHSRDIVTLLTEQADMLDQVHTIERNVLKDQMSFVKAEAIRLRGRAQSMFLRMLKTKTGESTGLVSHPEYREYERALKDVVDTCKDLIETAFEENHYADRAERDFGQYVGVKVTEMLQTATDYLNDTYHGSVVTREAIYDENQHIMEEMRNTISRMYYNAREISITARAQTTALREKFQKRIKEVLG